MSWIKIINYEAATDKLKKLYDRIKGKDDNVDNVLLIHSLRPHTLKGHLQLYKNILHHTDNTLPKWYLESLGVYVSSLNHCSYCVDHHATGLERLLDDEADFNKKYDALTSGALPNAFEGQYLIGLQYARQLTLNIGYITEHHIEQLRTNGFTDGEILEINQVVSYFNYVNRTVVGLGVTTEGDVLGLSPNGSDSDDFSHQ